MNKLFLSAIICFQAIAFQPFNSEAQTASSAHRNSKTGYDHLMPCGNPRPAAKTTADNATRVTGIANLVYDGTTYTPLDSTFLVYGTGRGSWYSHNDFVAINYDMATSYEYVGSSFNNHIRSTQTFDAHNNVLSYSEQPWISWISNWRNDYQELYTYDAMNNMLTTIGQYWDTSASAWVNGSRTTNTYTAANKLATSVLENWNNTTSTWENGFRSTNGYDASNFPTNSISESWSTTLSTWDSAYKITYATNSFGDITMETAQSWDATFIGWINVSRYTYTYDASRRLASELYETFDFPTATWENSSMTQYTGYVGDNAGTIVYQSWDNSTSTFINSNKDNYSFNSYNQPTFVYNETWDASTSNWMRVATSNFAQRFQYETYISGTPLITGISGKAVVYPVPAKEAISIDLTWDEPQAFTITITDMLGRTINSWNVEEAGRYTTTFPINDLSTGNYIIKMQGLNGKLIQRFVVEK